MERRQSGLGRCSMLPISVELPLILCRKKRPQRRRLEPGSARPRRGSAPAGFAGRAVADPALPACSPGPVAGATASPGSASGPRPAGRSGKEGPQTRGARPPAPAGASAPCRPRGRWFLTRKILRRRGPGSPGPEGRCGACASGRATWPLPAPSRHPTLRAVGAAPCPNEAETPRRKGLWLADKA